MATVKPNMIVRFVKGIDIGRVNSVVDSVVTVKWEFFRSNHPLSVPIKLEILTPPINININIACKK